MIALAVGFVAGSLLGPLLFSIGLELADRAMKRLYSRKRYF